MNGDALQPIAADVPLAAFALGVVLLAGMAIFAIGSVRLARAALRIEEGAVTGP